MLNRKRKKLPDHVGVLQYKLQVSLAMEEQGTINNKKTNFMITVVTVMRFSSCYKSTTFVPSTSHP